MRNVVRVLVALAGGFGLSFVAFGVLWIGTPWRYQTLMAIPFCLLAFAVTRTARASDNAFALILAGAAPLGGLITMFRDKSGSHLMPALVVSAWIIGTFAGRYLADRSRSRN